ncbi:MAG: electron transport complex subunit E [Clostridia bacterium]|nr:electron transport complex subunit E [Clostridia bacterium]
MKKSISSIFKEGILTNNPTFVQLLGMCPTLATTTSVVNALGMGAAVIVVLSFSNLFVSLLRKIIPKQVRIASYIVIISGFVTAVELLIKAYFPAINKALGLFIPLIVVNCIILARAESFASKNGPIESFLDGIATGIGFTLALTCIAFVRELIGTGALFAAADGSGSIRILGDWYKPATIFLMPTGAFLTLGCLIALVQKIQYTSEDRARRRRIELDAINGGFHETLMRDPVTGKIVRRPALVEGPAEAITAEPEEPAASEEKAEDKPAEEKPSEEKPADVLLTEEKPAEEKPEEEKPAEEKGGETE